MFRTKPKVAAIFSQDSLAIKLYRHSLLLRVKSKWRESGDTLIKCAEIYIKMKMLLEAATLYTEAAEVYMKVDEDEAIEAYKLSIKLYSNVGRFDITGKLEQLLGTIHLNEKHWDDACLHFRRAANYLASDKLIDQSDFCLQKCSECLILLGNYKEASNNYQILAKSCINTNLRRFNSHDHLLMSILCLMAIPESNITDIAINPVINIFNKKNKHRHDDDHDDDEDNNDPSDDVDQQDNISSNKSANKSTKSTGNSNTYETSSSSMPPLYLNKWDILYNINEQFDLLDYLWRRSKEKLFIRNVIKARMELDMHSFADHLYYWTNVQPLNELRTILLKVVYSELQVSIQLMLEEKQTREREVTLLLEKEKKKKKKQAALAAAEGSMTSGGGSVNLTTSIISGSDQQTVSMVEKKDEQRGNSIEMKDKNDGGKGKETGRSSPSEKKDTSYNEGRPRSSMGSM